MRRIVLWMLSVLLLWACVGCKEPDEIVPGPTPKPKSPEIVVNNDFVSAARMIEVTGYGEVIASPDFATIKLKVSGISDTAEHAGSICETNLQNVYEVADSLQVPKDSISDSGVNITAQQRPSDGAITGYLAMTTITIVIDDAQTANTVMSSIIDASSGELINVTYSLTDASAAYKEALMAAIADAQQKADTIASAAGVTRGRVIGVEETSGSDNALMGEDFETSAIEVSAHVVVRFAIP